MYRFRAWKPAPERRFSQPEKFFQGTAEEFVFVLMERIRRTIHFGAISTGPTMSVAQKLFPGHGRGICIRFNGKPGSTPTLLQWQAARRVSVSLARNNFPMAKTGVSNHFNGTA